MNSVVGQRYQRRAMMDNVDSVISKSIRTENVRGYKLESRRQLLPFKSYFHFRFGGRHLESIVNIVG
jgi:hypothetical protein